MNSGTIRVRFHEAPEAKTSKAGKFYCTAKAAVIVRGRDGASDKEADVYLKGFGVVAERMALARPGATYLVAFEYDVSEGFGEKNQGKVFLDRIVRSIGEEMSGARREAAPRGNAPAPARDDTDLPFAFVPPLIGFLTLGAGMASYMA